MKVEFELNVLCETTGQPKKKGSTRGIGELLKEYEHFYLIQQKKYRTCINKCDVVCGQAKIKFLGV
ncbi:MAG: hypothetical protein QJR05_05930 [Thermoanaerobacterium sp.]|nr:hypothetical protein [Thermoanaerobacterium sp.]